MCCMLDDKYCSKNINQGGRNQRYQRWGAQSKMGWSGSASLKREHLIQDLKKVRALAIHAAQPLPRPASWQGRQFVEKIWGLGTSGFLLWICWGSRSTELEMTWNLDIQACSSGMRTGLEIQICTVLAHRWHLARRGDARAVRKWV